MNSVFGLINLLEYKEENPEPLELAAQCLFLEGGDAKQLLSR